jgi:hypothetical protein
MRLLCRVFLIAFGAFAAEFYGGGCNGKIRAWHARHLLGDAISLAFERIVDSANRKLWLQV